MLKKALLIAFIVFSNYCHALETGVAVTGDGISKDRAVEITKKITPSHLQKLDDAHNLFVVIETLPTEYGFVYYVGVTINKSLVEANTGKAWNGFVWGMRSFGLAKNKDIFESAFIDAVSGAMKAAEVD